MFDKRINYLENVWTTWIHLVRNLLLCHGSFLGTPHIFVMIGVSLEVCNKCLRIARSGIKTQEELQCMQYFIRWTIDIRTSVVTQCCDHHQNAYNETLKWSRKCMKKIKSVPNHFNPTIITVLFSIVLLTLLYLIIRQLVRFS